MVALDPLTLAIQGANQQGQLDQDKDYATTPIIFHDSRNRTLIAAHHKDESFYVYDLHNLAAGPVWQRQTGTIIGMMPAYDPAQGPGGTLLFLDGLGRLNAVDPATGADRWPAVMVGSARGTMAVANGLVYLNLGPGGVAVVNETTGHLVTTLQPPNADKAYSGVVVSGGFVYWLSGAYLNAWSLPGGALPPAAPSQ
jgi:outer membrane protein assembly factor BamB